MRRDKLENLVAMGTFDGEKARRRLRVNYVYGRTNE